MADHCRTSSTIIAGAVNGSHFLRIKGYSWTKELLDNGKYVKSVSKNVGGHNWFIRYYPNGCLKDDSDCISLFLDLDAPGEKEVKAKFRFSLLDNDGIPVTSYSLTSPMHTYSSKESSWGYCKFIKKEDLEESGHLKDDCFEIRCDITFMKPIQSEETKQFVLVPPSSLNQHLEELLKNMDGYDVTFEVGGERFQAHRCILAARSSVFKAELFGDMAENSKRLIHIEDMDGQVFKFLLHFIYTDALPDMTAEDKKEPHADEAMAQHLLVAADRYNVERLKLVCEEKLCSYMNSVTVATILTLADQHNCHGLKEVCFEFLSSPSNFKAMLACDSFEHLKSSCPFILEELIARFLPDE
ncbi:hypothetical protein PR202_ga07337 [Eleusine coracana subsp. coracana]|uniref:Uncharacterized protein n=1 Tax=Eleusine coracana subsp. coracana TaxID=191504 RepID=A0AAV5BXB7_ELECO|nr:hypothetical protein QOZ80_2AG0110870 [Eleusine coracana subsp. coracana]GJM91003.1 hypothetical protein PR202_ga07337 [Eleusine coracana subsp. coracana]